MRATYLDSWESVRDLEQIPWYVRRCGQYLVYCGEAVLREFLGRSSFRLDPQDWLINGFSIVEVRSRITINDTQRNRVCPWRIDTLSSDESVRKLCLTTMSLAFQKDGHDPVCHWFATCWRYHRSSGKEVRRGRGYSRTAWASHAANRERLWTELYTVQ